MREYFKKSNQIKTVYSNVNRRSNPSQELKMTISGIVPKDGRRNIYVVFEDGERKAEGCVPDCVIEKNIGFTEDEVKMLELYLKQNLDMIREQAKYINPIKAFMKDES